MKPIQGYEFVVTGRHEFPWDMLRYDRCWPAGEDQITEMAPYFRGERYRQMRQVKLRGLNEPTDGRWESFGWIVSIVDRVSINV